MVKVTMALWLDGYCKMSLQRW